jgi:hypothetical protein
MVRLPPPEKWNPTTIPGNLVTEWLAEGGVAGLLSLTSMQELREMVENDGRASTLPGCDS